MKLAYFNEQGKFWCWAEDQTPGPNDVNISAEIDENHALWRYNYNTETDSVEIYQPTLNTAEAEAQLEIDLAAEAAEEE
jgi:hypothetical protein